ncbi:sugar MFS transporter [Dyadobacter sp. NIV53]|uniref:MFS transporter n=1 Tax=Dyadobacter sp. NIV53 TaxID=2861765 RepID=UPI001C883C72|nr:MFS transporter [Dyadobacter sp. NIV53]
MSTWKIKLSIFINYFIFAILLNSVGTVILQVQASYGINASSAAILEACKDLSIAGMSFFVASYLNRIGYRNAMLIALGTVAVTCIMMPLVNTFWMTKLLFAATGASFALIKVSVYATIGLVTKDQKEHISMMNFIESFFMIGILTGYFIFSAFIDDKNPQATGWTKVYFLLAGLAILAFLLLLSTPIHENEMGDTEKIESSHVGLTKMFQLTVMPIVMIFVASAFIYVLIEQSIMSWLPTFNNKVLHLPTALSIQMASILAASTAFGRFVAGIVLKRFSWIMVLICCILASAALVVFALPLAKNVNGNNITGWSNAPMVAFMFPLIGFFIAPIYPAINSIILSALPKQQHGMMSGLIVIFSALGGTTGSLITGHIFEAYGGQTAFYFSLIPMALLVICLVFFKRLQSKHYGNVDFSELSAGGH